MEISWRSDDDPITEEPPTSPSSELPSAPTEAEVGALPFVAVSKELPEKYEVLREELRQEIAADDPFGVGRVLQEFNQLCVERPDLITGWGRAIESDFAENGRVLGHSMPLEDLLRELEYGEVSVTNAVISAWEDSYDVDKALDLAEAINRQSERYDSAEAAYVCLRLARLLALVFPTAASSLANHAFETLPPQQRGWQFDQIEEQLAGAGSFTNFNVERQRFWGQRLLSPHREWEWESDESRDALESLSRMRGSWGGFALLHGIIPEEVWENYRLGTNEEVETPTLDAVDDSRSNWGCLIFLPIYMFIKLVLLDGCSSDDPSPPRFNPDQYQFQNYRDEQLEESSRAAKKLMEEMQRRSGQNNTNE